MKSRKSITPYFVSPVVLMLSPRGGGRESDPPTTFRPSIGFEDREGHQPPIASSPRIASALSLSPFG